MNYRRFTQISLLGLVCLIGNDAFLMWQTSEGNIIIAFFIFSILFGFITKWLVGELYTSDKIAYALFPLAFLVFVLSVRLQLWYIGLSVFVFSLIGVLVPQVSTRGKILFISSGIGLSIVLNLYLPFYLSNKGKNKLILGNLEDQRIQTNTDSSIVLSTLLNKPFVLISWTKNCAYCKLEIDEVLNELCEEYQSSVGFLALNPEDTWNEAIQFKTDFCPQIALSPEFSKNLGVRSYPSVVICASNGDIVYTHHGYIRGTNEVIKNEIRDVLNKLILAGNHR
ncbi:MAG: hypothetical protein GC181_02660 [Bacteroidetes bacterium]|nr:hypothetical protein [Bacteroidota bacterium]